MVAATRADSSDSMAASAAIATAAPTTVRSAPRSTCGSTGLGRCDGNSPMVATETPNMTTATVTTTTAVNDSGMLRCTRGRTIISTAINATTARLLVAADQSA